MGKFLDSLRDGFELVVDKTEELGKIGKIKVDIYSVKRDTEKKLTELGEKVFLLLEENENAAVAEDETVKNLMQVTSSYKEKIEEKEKEIETIREEKEKERQEKKTQKEEDEAKAETVDAEPVKDQNENETPDADNVEDAEFVEEKKKTD